MRNNDGILYWLTGLSGAGKSTIGRELYGLIRRKKPSFFTQIRIEPRIDYQILALL